MADEGWIKLYRSIRSNWLWENGNERYAKWWMDILLMVNHKPNKFLNKRNQLVTVVAGEMVTSERKLSEKWDANRRTVHKFLDLLVSDEMIEMKRIPNLYTTLKVNNYAVYQSKDGKNEPHSTPLSTPLSAHEQECKELKKNNVEFKFKEFFKYLNDKTGHKYRNTDSNRKLIKARLNEGYSKKDLSLVIEFKSNEWKGDPEMDKYLRPSTLFAPSHFENYLNEAANAITKSKNESTSDGQRKGLTAEEIKAKEEAQMRALVEKQKEAKHE